MFKTHGDHQSRLEGRMDSKNTRFRGYGHSSVGQMLYLYMCGLGFNPQYLVGEEGREEGREGMEFRHIDNEILKFPFYLFMCIYIHICIYVTVCVVTYYTSLGNHSARFSKKKSNCHSAVLRFGVSVKLAEGFVCTPVTHKR